MREPMVSDLIAHTEKGNRADHFVKNYKKESVDDLLQDAESHQRIVADMLANQNRAVDVVTRPIDHRIMFDNARIMGSSGTTTNSAGSQADTGFGAASLGAAFTGFSFGR